jgi:hydrogenase/urease accessory protein HupE
MSIVQLIIVLVVIGVVMGLVHRYLPIAEPWKTIINVVAVLGVCLLLLRMVGLF